MPRSLAVVLCLAAAVASAQAAPVPPPSPEAVRSVWRFFHEGQGQGLVLADLKACSEIARDGPQKFECAAEVGPEGVKAGTTVMLWQAYLVPQGDVVEDVVVQLKLGGTVRETKDLKLKGETMRTRTWTGLRLPKPGTWTLAIVRGDQVLKELRVKAF